MQRRPEKLVPYFTIANQAALQPQCLHSTAQL
jgi:hypothetical protein